LETMLGAHFGVHQRPRYPIFN